MNGAGGSRPTLVLASGSPRRRQLLESLGLEIEVRPADIDETPLESESGCDCALRLAEAKARSVVREGELVLAADTVVVLEGDLLGKPGNAAEAAAMLRRLSGREHEVMTGVAVCDLSRSLRLAFVEVTKVRFAELSEAEIAWYVATGEPLDKAGAYGIQGHGSLFVDAIEGNYSNVVGLPLAPTYRLLRRAGYPWPGFDEVAARGGSPA